MCVYTRNIVLTESRCVVNVRAEHNFRVQTARADDDHFPRVQQIFHDVRQQIDVLSPQEITVAETLAQYPFQLQQGDGPVPFDPVQHHLLDSVEMTMRAANQRFVGHRNRRFFVHHVRT